MSPTTFVRSFFGARAVRWWRSTRNACTCAQPSSAATGSFAFKPMEDDRAKSAQCGGQRSDWAPIIAAAGAPPEISADVYRPRPTTALETRYSEFNALDTYGAPCRARTAPAA